MDVPEHLERIRKAAAWLFLFATAVCLLHAAIQRSVLRASFSSGQAVVCALLFVILHESDPWAPEQNGYRRMTAFFLLQAALHLLQTAIEQTPR